MERAEARTRLGNNGNSVLAVGTAPYAPRKLSSNKGYLKYQNSNQAVWIPFSVGLAAGVTQPIKARNVGFTNPIYSLTIR